MSTYHFQTIFNFNPQPEPKLWLELGLKFGSVLRVKFILPTISLTVLSDYSTQRRILIHDYRSKTNSNLTLTLSYG